MLEILKTAQFYFKNERVQKFNVFYVHKFLFALKNSLTLHENQLVERGTQEEQRLLVNQGQLRVDVVDLTRLAQIKADEREHKARDFLKAELRYQKSVEDLKTKQIAIRDNAKKYSEVQKRYINISARNIKCLFRTYCLVIIQL